MTMFKGKVFSFSKIHRGCSHYYYFQNKPYILKCVSFKEKLEKEYFFVVCLLISYTVLLIINILHLYGTLITINH
jgi:hypothetical protein